MAKWLVPALLAGMSALCAPAAANAKTAAPAAEKLVLDGVSVVDPRNGAIAPNRAVVISDGKIVDIVAAGSARKARGVRRVDARGKYVVPGFLDMHAHPLDPADPELSLPLMVSYGVTGYRRMGGSPAMLKARREGTLPTGTVPAALAMPGMVLAGPPVATPEGARAVVRRQHADGADFIKGVDMPPASYFAVLDEARKLGLPVAGHLPPSIDVREAVARGMKAIEHLGPHVSILEACSTREGELRARLSAVPPGGSKINFSASREQVMRLTANPILLTPEPLYGIFDAVLDSYDEGKCRDLAKSLKDAGNWQVPTLIREKSMQFGNDPYFRDDPRLRYVPVATRRLWGEVGNDFDKLTPAQKQTMRRLFERDLALVKLLDDAGVKMLAGSDMGGIWLIPGVSLHQEFDLLSQAGLTPLRILQMTTINGAEFLGKQAEMGTVEPGKKADLVLLDANPLESVQNFHGIAGVVLAGRYLPEQELMKLREKVAAGAANDVPLTPPAGERSEPPHIH